MEVSDERGGRRAPASAGRVPAVNPFRTGSQGGPRQIDQAQFPLVLCHVSVDLPVLVELISGGIVVVHKHANIAGGGAAAILMIDTGKLRL